jgi:threonine/homoserine/homoserine lactone efflux protein
MLIETTALLGVLAALTVGVISPGPSFVMVARMAVATSRAKAIAAALGMGAGGVLFGAAALLGLHAVFQAVPWLYVALKLAGGAYLCYLGILIFRSAKQPLVASSADDAAPRAQRAFWLGLATQVSNPKTAVVYGSVFAALLPQNFSVPFALVLLALVFCIEAGWYALVALVLSAGTPLRIYLARIRLQIVAGPHSWAGHGVTRAEAVHQRHSPVMARQPTPAPAHPLR